MYTVTKHTRPIPKNGAKAGSLGSSARAVLCCGRVSKELLVALGPREPPQSWARSRLASPAEGSVRRFALRSATAPGEGTM